MKNTSVFATMILALFYAVVFGGIFIGGLIFFVGFVLELAKDCPIAIPFGIIGIIYLILHQVAVFGKK